MINKFETRRYPANDILCSCFYGHFWGQRCLWKTLSSSQWDCSKRQPVTQRNISLLGKPLFSTKLNEISHWAISSYFIFCFFDEFSVKWNILRLWLRAWIMTYRRSDSEDICWGRILDKNILIFNFGFF